jgi:hypothetical protein
MPASLIDSKTLISLTSTGKGTFTHQIKKVSVPSEDKVFYAKEMKSATIARLEVLAQEFFRLIIATQPETWIAYDAFSGTFFVLSEEVKGYKQLPNDLQNQFTQGMYPGLGQIMISSVFLQEIDLKNGNIGLNQRNHVVKIDGDWCFADIRDASFRKYKKNITPELLSHLPFPKDYYAFNWLDICNQGIAHQTSRIVEPHLAHSPHFRNEINEALLKIILLTDRYLHCFVEAYIPGGVEADVFIDYLKKRREELKLAALQDASFGSYLISDEAKNTFMHHIIHIKGFVANACYPIIKSDEHEVLDTEMMLLFSSLVSSRNNNKIKVQALTSSNKLEQRLALLKNINFDGHVAIFTRKQKEMDAKALYNPNYINAAKKISVFCQVLMDAKKTFLHSNKILEEAKTDFNRDCALALTEVRPSLEHHREWEGIIRKFILDLFSLLTGGLINNTLGLFARTDSVKKLDDLDYELGNALSNK